MSINPVMPLIRLFREEDSTGVSALFRVVYGEDYVYPEVYLPTMLGRYNAAKHWYSAVAVQDDQVLGHAALWRDDRCPLRAELALIAVHPQMRGQGIATALGQYLCDQAREMGLSILTIKQVSSHNHSQRLAQNLGFHTTGLLPDYVTSPFDQTHPESIVLGCLPLQSWPFPELHWPLGWQNWLKSVTQVFGQEPLKPEGAVDAEISMTSHGQRLEVWIEKQTTERIKEVAELPARKLVYVKLPVGEGTLQAMQILQQAGFACTGFVPGHHHRWEALLVRGHSRKELSLSCQFARSLHQQSMFACAVG
ncbi:GNAT family N-acetyltransferase [Photorhabdus cinerea]|uniref:GNAT family N-acetyltransferase n=1 Tax=Photorhabdus cinerea TaxID=471575 RepID=A0A7X5QGW9_9GAMM|nr:GNAT family N-acetyltransferase [Photorhabdus cinerea]NHB94087.1 GNAT family N-acetyltransferase [Photorhabdus cinerea]